MFKLMGISILFIFGAFLCATGISMWLGLLFVVIAIMSLFTDKMEQSGYASFLEGHQRREADDTWSFTVFDTKGVEYKSRQRFPDRGLARLKMYLFCKEVRDAETVSHYLVRVRRPKETIENKSEGFDSLAGSSASLG